MSLTEGHPGNRSRRPDWRWLYAIALREIGLPSHAVAVDWTRRRLGENGVVDDWTVRVLRFLEGLEREGEPGLRDVVAVDRALGGAYKIWIGPGRPRAEVEARLVAGQDAAGIAARTLIPEDGIRAYEAVFYNVADRLECTDWVAACCFGPRAYRGYSAEDYALIWKIIAYRMGPEALDLAIDARHGGSVSGVRDEANGPETEAGLAIRSYIDVMTLPLDDAGTVKVLRLLDLEERLEAERIGRGAGVASASLIVGDRAVEAAVLATAAIDRGNDVEADRPRPVDEGRDGAHDEAEIDLLDSRSA
jgi:hypothetical protein